MSHHLPMKKSLRFFTMMEMITVMVVLGILVTVTMSVASVDSTKANSQIIAGALNFASSYALGNTSNQDYNNNNRYDSTVRVDITANKVVVTFVNELAGTSTELNTYNLSKGSHVRQIDSTDLGTGTKTLYFSSVGEPLNSDTMTDVVSGNTEITVSKKSDDDNYIKLYMRAFTGKVTYY